ncbi:uncharacterized protein [Dermacentor andersoni]|uniref:uncharacterized protein isoform X1 n=1 Tax=Dermacentor andersoni TaxID=34620 RepID=UPI003B3B042B
MTTHYPSRMRFNERLQLDCLGHINMVNYIRKHNLDLSMCRMEDSDFAGDFELDLQPGTQQVTALAGYFDCTFELPVPRCFPQIILGFYGALARTGIFQRSL